MYTEKKTTHTKIKKRKKVEHLCLITPRQKTPASEVVFHSIICLNKTINAIQYYFAVREMYSGKGTKARIDVEEETVCEHG